MKLCVVCDSLHIEETETEHYQEAGEIASMEIPVCPNGDSLEDNEI